MKREYWQENLYTKTNLIHNILIRKLKSNIMKKKKSTLLIVSMSFLLSIGTLMFSSCADKDDPSPILPTPEDTPYILKLKFSEKVEFKVILNKNDIQDLTETETA